MEHRRHTPSLSAEEVAALIAGHANVQILDVRRFDEYTTMNIPGSISVPGGNYRSYLMSGLFAQSTLFMSATVAVAVATDMTEGVIDRFKTLPIARSSVLIGRTVSTVIVGLPSLAVMIGVWT